LRASILTPTSGYIIRLLEHNLSGFRSRYATLRTEILILSDPLGIHATSMPID
jgi:hypothetical protein